MNRRLFTASALSTAMGLVLAMQVVPVQADMKTQHLQKCFGINAVAKNDCAAGAHSCAGQTTKARDPKSYVLLPAGDCSKIAGGSLKPT